MSDAPDEVAIMTALMDVHNALRPLSKRDQRTVLLRMETHLTYGGPLSKNVTSWFPPIMPWQPASTAPIGGPVDVRFADGSEGHGVKLSDQDEWVLSRDQGGARPVEYRPVWQPRLVPV